MVFGSEGAKEIAKPLKTNKTLMQLQLQVRKSRTFHTSCEFQLNIAKENGIGAEGAKEIAKALKINKILTQLFLQVRKRRIYAAKSLNQHRTMKFEQKERRRSQMHWK